MTDRTRCMAPLHGPRCPEPPTHESHWGHRCARHAEEMRRMLRDPRALGNRLAGSARTEEEIAFLVVELPS